MSNEFNKGIEGRRDSPIHRRYYHHEPFSIEKISPELQPCAKTLKRAGCENLIPLLDEEIEGRVLYGLEKCLIDVLNKNKPSSQPRKRKADEEKEIRTEVQELMEKAAQNGYIPQGVTPTIRVIPPEKLYGLCAPINIDKPLESLLTLTDMGKAILSLLKRRSQVNENPDHDSRSGISLFYVAGRANEANETKPLYRKRGELSALSYRIPVLRNSSEIDPQGNLRNDFDFMVCAPIKPRGFTSGIGYEDLAKSLNDDVFGKLLEGRAEVKKSSRREFERVELRTIVKRKKVFLGHIFGPGLKGKYDPNNRLLSHYMETARDIPVMLVPYYHPGEGWMFWGVAVDFFGGYKDVYRHRLDKQFWLDREYSIALYPFPEIAFPLENPQELLFHLGRSIRSWAYNDKHPIMRSSHIPPITEEELDNADNLKPLSKDTQEYLTYHALYPLSRDLYNNSSRLGSKSQRMEFGISFLEDIALGMEGDPIATILRLLPAGVTLTKNPQDFLSNIDVYGLGIFDKDGLFPEIGKLLDDRLILTKLKNEIYKYQDNLERAKEGWGKPASGKGLLFDFLFNLANNNPLKALELLRPVWCNAEEWKTMMDENMPRLLAIDTRFSIKGDRMTLTKQILEIALSNKKPLTASALAAQLEKHPSVVFHVLDSLAKEGQIVRLGGHRIKRGGESRGLGEGGGSVSFCSKTVANELIESGSIFRYKTPREKIIELLSKNPKSATIQELKKASHLSTTVISSVLKKLEAEGIVEKKGFTNWNELWAFKRDLKN